MTTTNAVPAIPDDVRGAFLSVAKRWVLGNYVGDRKRLEPWSDHYASITSVHSYDFPGNTGKNLRRLVRLAKTGALIERHQYRPGAVRSFTAPRALLDEIGAQAVAEWEAAGYVVGVMVPTLAGTTTTSKETA